MLLAHAIAAVLAVLALRRGEALTLFVLALLTAPLRTPPARVLLGSPEWRAVPVVDRRPVGGASALVVHSVRRRGPPATAVA
jgi:hypothetical protein